METTLISCSNCSNKLNMSSLDYPTLSVSRLSTPSAFVVWCVQYWCRLTKNNIDPSAGIKEAFDKANINSSCSDVSSEFDNIMKYISVSSRQDFSEIYGTCHNIGNLEKIFLIVLSLEQNNKGHLSSRVLNSYLPLSSSRIIGSKFYYLSRALTRVKLYINLEPELIDTMAIFLTRNNPSMQNNRTLN